MKLYTEEDLKDAFYKGFYTTNETECCVKAPADVYCRKYIKTLTPIELPSDEDISYEAITWDVYNMTQIEAFKYGVKWMKEQINNQNK